MPKVDIATAPERVKAVIEDIKARRKVNEVNNFWTYLANDPAMLEATWSMAKAVMGPGSLDPKVKELIYVAVSLVNQCQYCIKSHTAMAKAKGASEEDLKELYAVVALANLTNRLAIAYEVPVDESFKR